MIEQPKYSFIFFFGLALLLAGGPSSAKAQTQGLALSRVGFDPPFVQAGTDPTVHVEIELRDAPIVIDALNLERLVPGRQGNEDVRRIAALFDDGRGVDAKGGDGIYSARFRFEEPAVCSRRLRISVVDEAGDELVSPAFTLPSAGSYLPTAEYSAPFVLEPGQDGFVSIVRADESDRPGMAVLTIADAAPVQSAGDALVDVRLNRESIASLVPGEACVEALVDVNQAELEIEIENDGKESAIAVRVDVVADTFRVSPLARPSNLRPTLGRIAEAMVKAQTEPVAGARVRFQLETDRGEETAIVAVTDTAGRATAAFPGKLAEAESFELDAVLLDDDPALVDQHGELAEGYGDVFEDRAPLTMSQSSERQVLEVGEEAIVDLTVRVNARKNQRWEVDLTQILDFESILQVGGEPLPERMSGTGPAARVFRQRFSAAKPGICHVSTDASFNHNDGDASSELLVEVVDKGLGGPLVIHRPSSVPGIIEPAGELRSLVFKAVVSGTETPPASLILEEGFVADGELQFEDSGFFLTDDGPDSGGPDAIAGDLVYTGIADVGASEPERRQFRISAPELGEKAVSPVYPFEIGFIPNRPSPPADDPFFEMIEDPATGERFVANQLLIKFRDDVSPDRVETIVGQEEASLIGFVPLVDVVQAAIPGSGTPEDVRRAIASFESYAEVEFAEPDHEVVPAAFPDDPQFGKQTSLGNVQALEAWLGAGNLRRPSHVRNIAIIDSGVDLTHADLADRVVRRNGQIVGKDATRTEEDRSCEERDDQPPQAGNHGTKVAGIAAAGTGNGTDIAGAAMEGRFVSVRVLNGDSSVSQVSCGLDFVTANPDVARIANLSLQTDSRSQTLRLAVERALQGGVLVVAAAGNGDDGNGGFVLEAYPAAFADVRGLVEDAEENGLIAVANVDDQGRGFKGDDDFAADFYGTRQGAWVDLAAPGVAVTTTANGGGVADPDTGTSFSAPLVAGAAALMWSRNHGATIEKVEAMLKGATTPFRQGWDQIGQGLLDYGAGVFNGGVEIDAPNAVSPAAWRGRARTICQATAGSRESRRGFYRAREGNRFLVCGPIDVAVTEKRLRVPAGVERLVGSVKMAGIAFDDQVERVRLRIELARPDGTVEVIQRPRPKVERGRCGNDLDLPDAPGGRARPSCSKWKAIEDFVVNDPPAEVVLRFSARPINGNGPVYLLLDDLQIDRAE